MPLADAASPSLRSRAALNAANFFLAETAGVFLPFLSDLLREHGWRYDSIGVAGAVAGLGVFLMQTPAGFVVDRVHARRRLLAIASLTLGVCYGVLPLVPARWWVVDPLLFVGGVSQSFVVPLTAALALGLVGRAGLSRIMGVNQGWNHAGNLAAALSAIGLVSWLGLPAVFYCAMIVSLLAAASTLLVDAREVDSQPKANADQGQHFTALLRDRRVVILFVAILLFHLANAPTMPLVALYLKQLHGSDAQVAGVVLVAQAVMVPVAIAAGRLCERWGRKPVFAIGFLVLPLRIFLYSRTQSPWALIAMQSLDGVGAGIYGVAVVAMSADLTQDKGHFNALMGVFATALALGGVLGPLVSGFVVQHLGFARAFYVFAGVAAVAAAVFLLLMPETAAASDAPAREPT